jgi:hypothetical protein
MRKKNLIFGKVLIERKLSTTYRSLYFWVSLKTLDYCMSSILEFIDVLTVLNPFADGGLRGHVPTRPGCTTPLIRFLYVAPHLRIGLPPDPASRRRPCRSPILRLCEYLV